MIIFMQQREASANTENNCSELVILSFKLVMYHPIDGTTQADSFLITNTRK